MRSVRPSRVSPAMRAILVLSVAVVTYPFALASLEGSRTALALLTITTMCMALAAPLHAFYHSGFSAGLFSPGGLPNAVVALTTGVPGALLAWRPEAAQPAFGIWQIDTAAGIVLLASSAGFSTGCLLMPEPHLKEPGPVISARELARLSRIGLTLSALGLSAVLLATGGRSYGEGQIDKGLDDSLLVISLLLLSCCTVTLWFSNSLVGGRLRSLSNWPFIAIPTALTLLLQGRTGVVAVGVILLALGVIKGNIRLWGAAAIFTTVLLLVVAVPQFRTGPEFGRDGRVDVVETLRLSTASVADTTALTFTLLDEGDYRYGATYLNSLFLVVPGPLVRAFAGPVVVGTGTSAFRALIGYENPDQDFGYSVPAESYLNFGLMGAIGVPLMLAAGMTRLWSNARTLQLRAGGLLYFVLLGSFPILWRSDILAFLKTTAYSWIVLGLLLAATRQRIAKVGTSQVGGRSRVNAIGHRREA